MEKSISECLAREGEKDEEHLNGSNSKRFSVVVIGNSYAVKSGVEASSGSK